MKILLFALLFFPIIVSAQSIFPLGSPTQGQQARFGFILDTCLKVPIKDTIWPAVYTSVTPEACLVYRRSDSSYYFNNGSNWNNRILTLRKAQSLFITSVPAQSFASLTGKPATLSGYGIVDAYPLTGNPSGFITGINSSMITTALGFTPLSTEVDGIVTNEGSISVGSGSSTSSTINSNTLGSAAVTVESGQGILITEAGNTITVSDSKKQETFSGTTSGSGTYTVSFGVAYSVAPNAQVACTNCTDTQRARITAITTTGFTVQGRNEALGLIFSNANGLTVDVLITEK